jgi:DNA-binding beta-propeller fold protein YncE
MRGGFAVRSPICSQLAIAPPAARTDAAALIGSSVMAWRYRGSAMAFLLLAGALLQADRAAASDLIEVVLDQAKIVKLPDRVGTIVVGNPLIADVSVQAGGMLVVTGKGYGRTNVIVLDRAGNVLAEKSVQVQGPGDNVVVIYRGADRESYSCSPNCERRITLGDAPAYFDAALNQAGNRVGQAMGGGQAAPSPQR